MTGFKVEGLADLGSGLELAYLAEVGMAGGVAFYEGLYH